MKMLKSKMKKACLSDTRSKTLRFAEKQEVEDRCRFSFTDVETSAASVEGKGSLLAAS